MNHLKLITIIVFAFFLCSKKTIAQITNENTSTFITEVGIGYPISLSDQHEAAAVFFNLGYNKQVNSGLSIGPYIFTALDVDYNPNLSGGLGVRLGKVINNNDASIDIGYTVMSKKYGKFPGPLIGINLPLSDRLGLHVRYKQLSSAALPDRKVFEVGINVGEYYIKRAVLPAIGIVAIGGAIIVSIISGSI